MCQQLAGAVFGVCAGDTGMFWSQHLQGLGHTGELSPGDPAHYTALCSLPEAEARRKGAPFGHFVSSSHCYVGQSFPGDGLIPACTLEEERNSLFCFA